MNRIRLSIPLLAFLCVQGMSQTDMYDRRPAQAHTIFTEVLSYATTDSGKSRIEVYVQVPYEEIEFVRRDQVFVGTYDVAVIILTPEQEQVWNRVQTIEVREKEFSHTVSNRLSSLKQMTFDVAPGNYDVRIEVRDAETRKTATIKRKLLVSDYSSADVTMSDVMLVSRLTTNGEKRSIVPNISGNIAEETEGFFVFFELYTKRADDPVRIAATMVNARGDSMFSVEHQEAPGSGVHQVFLRFPEAKLPIGSYVIKVNAYSSNAKDLVAATTSRSFSVRWSDIPFTISDIDKAIDQMRYIARESDIDVIRRGDTPDDRRKRFLEYWAKRDPDPNTQRNELMEEYYQRVEYANRNFSHYLDGWRTDRGMVYIRFGPPENVERYPFETNSRPYETWRYYNLNYEFVFVDETGFGDYRLRYPTTDLLGRLRPDN